MLTKRLRQGKGKIRTWEKMKTKLKARFLPPTCIQNNYSLLHHLTQGSMSVEEYTREFEKLLIKFDLQQTIVRYLGGLDPKYAHVVDLQAFTTFDGVCILAHKVEQQMKNGQSKETFLNLFPLAHLFMRRTHSNPPNPYPP